MKYPIIKCYCLKFRSPFHVDTRGTGFYEQSDHYIQSATLSAAIVSMRAMLAPNDAKSWASDPAFLVSSAFPYYQEKQDHHAKTYYFLPRPINSMANVLERNEIQHNFKHIKKINKIKWLESSLWAEVVTNPKIEYHTIHIIDNILACHKSIGNQMPSRFWAEEQKPRLYTDRFTNQAIDGRVFRFGRIYFESRIERKVKNKVEIKVEKNCGLYFLAKFENNDTQSKFESALTLLGDSGIGSDRSTGNGLFTWESNDQFDTHLIAPNQGPHVCLSLLNPCINTERGIDWIKESHYQLLTNAGWIGTSGKRRKSIRMFVEGSCFPIKITGKIEEIGESQAGYKVYRDGRGFFL